MAYDKTQLRLLVSRGNADGMNEWTYDDTVDPATVAAAGYISNAKKQLTDPGAGMVVGDRVWYRRFTSLTTKTTITSITQHTVTAVGSSGATLTSVAAAVVEDALAVTLTATQSGSTIVFDKTDGVTVTLPAPQLGLEFNFMVDTVSASVGHKVITDAATTFIKGALILSVIATPTVATDVGNGTSHIAMLMNGTTTGGIAGSWFKLICRSATIWEVVAGMNLKSGSAATVFSTT